jgi:hypothetical protein
VHWFNPMLWLARRRCRADRELARDAMVLAITGTTEAQDYGQTLLQLAKRAPARAPLGLCPGIVGVIDARADLRRRIAMISRFDARRTRPAWFGITLLLMVGCATLTNPRSPSSKVDRSPGSPDPGTMPTTRVDTVRNSLTEPQDEASALRVRLDRKLPEVKFDGIAFSDVVDYLRDISGGTIFVKWKALKEGGIDKNSPITARLSNIKFSKALQVILDSVSTAQTKVGYVIDDGVITISCGDDLIQDVHTRVYDIRDLIVIVPDYKAPDVDSAPSASPATQPGAGQATREQLVQSVIDLIRETVAPDSWASARFARIKELSGQLIITQTLENHALIAALLDQLRETRGIQVNVESRFIVVDKAIADRFKLGANPASDQDDAKAGERSDICLSPDKVADLLREIQHSPTSSLIAAPRITCFNGQQAYIQVGSQTPYVGGYDITKTSDGRTTCEAVQRHVDTGLLMELQPTVSADRKFVTLNLHPAVSRLDRIDSEPFPDSPPGQKLFIQNPVLTRREIRTTVNIADGATLVLSEFTGRNEGSVTKPAKPAPQTQPDTAIDAILDHLGPDRRLFLLVNPTILRREEEGKRFSPGRP